jgi:uncharacterized protein with PIN domain
MSTAFFKFQGDINNFLSARQRNTTISYNFDESPSIKDSIEALGIPHTEVEAILINTVSVDFNYLLKPGDQIEVYGVYAELPNQPLVPLRPALPAEVCFVLDAHLGQLASYLRMLGFDTLYRNDYDDEELAAISSQEQRVLLTRDKGLLKRSIVTYGYFVRETNPQRQVVEILRRYKLLQAISPLHRCIRCNGQLQPVSKAAIEDRLDQKTRDYYNEFSLCRDCNQIYWKGSHYQHMRDFIDKVLNE